MINPVFITTGDSKLHPGWLQLKRSLEHFGWEYHFIEHPWLGLADRINKLAMFIESNRIDYFVFGDAYDVFVLGDPHTFTMKLPGVWNKMVYMAERGCYPVYDYEKDYPPAPFDDGWRYLNGGCFAGKASLFLEYWKNNPLPDNINDQQWSTENFLFRNNNRIILDYACSVFQSIAFANEDDYAVRRGQYINLVTLSRPIIFHGNGQTPMDKIYSLLA